jgi:hypothetical protein
MYVSIERKGEPLKLRALQAHLESWDSADPKYTNPESEIVKQLNKALEGFDPKDEEGLVYKAVTTSLKYCRPATFCNVFIFDEKKQTNYMNTLGYFKNPDGTTSLGYESSVMTREFK